MKAHLLSIAIATATAAMLSACSLNDDNSSDFIGVSTGDTIILTDNGVIASVNKAAPDVLVSTRTVTGLNAGDQLIGIDYRPKDGKLYGVGVASNGAARVYTIDPTTGSATLLRALEVVTTPAVGNTPATKTALLIGGDRGMMALDFNPVPDRLRLITNTDKSYRINVDTGETIIDGDLNGANVTVTAVAYTNSVNGTASTELYDIDVDNDRVYLQDPPNSGGINTTRSAALGVNAIESAGFDIDPANNQGFAALKVGTAFGLYSIDLNQIATSNNAVTETTRKLNSFFTTNGIRGLALKPATDAGLTAVGLSANNQIVKFKPNDAAALSATPPVSAAATVLAVTGLATGDTLVGIDYRLRTNTANVGVLYGLTRNSSGLGKIYTINTTTGAATLISTLAADTTDMSTPYTSLDGTSFAVDFNPVPDRLRVVSNTGKNYRINVDTGLVFTDTDLNGVANAIVTAGAYTNSFASSAAPATTKLFNLDQQTPNQLLEQTNPNAGTLAVIGPFGNTVVLGNNVGFDIASGFNGLNLGINGKSLFTVNLATGAATTRGTIGDAMTPDMIDIALLIK